MIEEIEIKSEIEEKKTGGRKKGSRKTGERKTKYKLYSLSTISESSELKCRHFHFALKIVCES
jgi:hypothetical protein